MDFAKKMKTLGDETRARIMALAMAHELSVGEMVHVLDMSQPRVSRHLRILAESGFVRCRRDGQMAYYRAPSSGVEKEFLSCLAPYLNDDPHVMDDLERAADLVARRARESRRFFDSVARDWDKVSREVLGGLDLAGEISRRIPENLSVADLGCGPGALVEALSRKARLTIGVDNSPRMLEQAARNLGLEQLYGQSVNLRIGELEHLPLREAEVEAAVFSLALHHVEDPEAALKEAARILAPGGRLVVAEFDSHDVEAMRDEFKDRWLGFARSQMNDFFRSSGFEEPLETVFEVERGLSVVVYETARKSG